MQTDQFKTIESESHGQYKDRGSKFFAFAYPIQSEDEVKHILQKLKKKYHDARHHCFAYKIGYESTLYRINDDGEPSGTAGRPIFGQIVSNELTNILVVVVRYFGGTLLGTSGLINAYRCAASQSILNARVICRYIHKNFRISFRYAHINSVMRIIKEENINILKQEFMSDCNMTLSIRHSKFNIVKERMHKLKSLNMDFD